MVGHPVLEPDHEFVYKLDTTEIRESRALPSAQVARSLLGPQIAYGWISA
jgi:hypothetical protein